MQNTPASERTFISFFGAVNAGKSSVVNRVTGQTLSIVSDTPGTTTDPGTATDPGTTTEPPVEQEKPGWLDPHR